MTALHAAIVLLLGTLLLAVVVREIVRGHLRVGHALLWVVIAVAFTATPLLYEGFTFAHERWGWPTATSTIVLLGFAFLLILLLNQTVAISRGWRERKRLAQRLALLENRLHEFSQQQQKKS